MGGTRARGPPTFDGRYSPQLRFCARLFYVDRTTKAAVEITVIAPMCG
jgi:hypothetical protein